MNRCVCGGRLAQRRADNYRMQRRTGGQRFGMLAGLLPVPADA